MKKMKNLSVQVGDITCFEVPKRGGATIRGGVTIRGNMVHRTNFWQRTISNRNWNSGCWTLRLLYANIMWWYISVTIHNVSLDLVKTSQVKLSLKCHLKKYDLWTVNHNVHNTLGNMTSSSIEISVRTIITINISIFILVILYRIEIAWILSWP